MKVKFNRNFYTDPSFYIYFIVTFFWILDIGGLQNEVSHPVGGK